MASGQPLAGPLGRLRSRAWHWLTWPSQARQLKREGFTRTGFMQWEHGAGAAAHQLDTLTMGLRDLLRTWQTPGLELTVIADNRQAAGRAQGRRDCAGALAALMRHAGIETATPGDPVIQGDVFVRDPHGRYSHLGHLDAGFVLEHRLHHEWPGPDVMPFAGRTSVSQTFKLPVSDNLRITLRPVLEAVGRSKDRWAVSELHCAPDLAAALLDRYAVQGRHLSASHMFALGVSDEYGMPVVVDGDMPPGAWRIEEDGESGQLEWQP